MNKNIVLGSIAVIIVVLFALTLNFDSNNSENIKDTNKTDVETTDSTSVKNTVAPKTTNIVKTETFTNVLPKVGNYECNYETVTQSMVNTNTVYLSDGKMRAEFRSQASSGVVTSSAVVYDGTYLYTWTEGQPVGTVSRPKSISDFPVVIPRDLVESKSLGSGVNSASWSCHPWSKNPSMLVKPSYVKF